MITKELAMAVLDASSACPEFKEIAQKYIDSIGTEKESKYAKYLVAEAKEDICSIDSAINFLKGDFAKQLFGESGANEKLAHAEKIKAEGGIYCGCEGCTAAKAIIDNE